MFYLYNVLINDRCTVLACLKNNNYYAPFKSQAY